MKTDNQTRPTYALLDSGASVSAISKSLVKEMNLITRLVDIDLETFENRQIVQMQTTSFKISDVNNSMVITVYDALVGGILTSEHESPCGQSVTDGYEHLKDVVIHELPEKSIGLLIGARFARHYFGREVRLGGDDEPIGVLTDFGWCVVGPLSDRDNLVDIKNIDVHDEESSSEFDKLEKLITRMYRHDFIARPEEEFPQEMRHNSQND